MDIVVAAGKSKKNVDAYILIPPEAKQAIDTLIETREDIDVPKGDNYFFAYLNYITPLSGNEELQQLAQECPGMKYPEQISSTSLRRYIATVSQVRCILFWLISFIH